VRLAKAEKEISEVPKASSSTIIAMADYVGVPRWRSVQATPILKCVGICQTHFSKGANNGLVAAVIPVLILVPLYLFAI